MKTITVDGKTLRLQRLIRVPLIYVSGPLTTGHMPQNIRNALEIAFMLMKAGYSVIVPHEKALLMEVLYPMSYAEWLRYDFQCILSCDAVYRMSGESRGADLEVRFAESRGIPVFRQLIDLAQHVPPDKYARVAKGRKAKT
jgi:nucleoside 2-deoxyribosyltransferase